MIINPDKMMKAVEWNIPMVCTSVATRVHLYYYVWNTEMVAVKYMCNCGNDF